MENTLSTRVRFGDFELDPKSGQLSGGGQTVYLPEKPFRLLLVLIEHEGGLVSREDIKKKLWPNDTAVDFEHGINTAIRGLRRNLGDSAEQSTYIETVPRRGYRLMVPVERIAESGESAGSEGAPLAGEVSEGPGVQIPRGELIGRTVSHYRVLDIIGGGGMGVVYRAEDLKLCRAVALKFLPEDLGSDPLALERFSREARAASSLDHTNICAIYEFGEHEGHPFIVMQLLEGQTLRDRLAASQGSLPLEELLDLGIQVSHGLQAAHERGILHRDIKPANIFLTRKGVCKVLDFGLAKLLEAEEEATPGAGTSSGSSSSIPLGLTLSRTGSTMGTAGYMSPEQVRGERLDARSDLFSFGLVLYEMATGHRTFTGETAADVRDAILYETPKPTSELNSEIPSELEYIINKCLEKDREARYQRAADLCTDLQRLKRESSSLSNTTDASRTKVLPALPWWRSKLAIAVGSLVLVCLIFAAVFYGSHRQPVAGSSRPAVSHRQITFVGDAYAPAISPDGKSVAYVTSPVGSDEKLMLQDLSDGAILELLHGHLAGPRWSPDGGELVFNMPDKGKNPYLFTISRLGGAPREVAKNGSACWLPDGLQIVSARWSQEGGIWLTNKLTGAERKIPAPQYRWLLDIDCSPRSGMLLLLTETSRKAQIWTMKPDGTEQRKLVEWESGVRFRSPRWSATGDAIYYFRGKKGEDTGELVKLPVSGQPAEPSVLVNGLEAGESFTLTADGSQLAYTRTQSYSNLWSVEVPAQGASATAHEKSLTSGTSSNLFPSISPDGRWVVYTMFSGTKSNIYKMTADGGQPVQLTFFDAARASSPAWSPDGRRIAFISDQGGSAKVWIVNAEGGSARPLDKTNASDSNYQLSWAPSAEIVYQQPGLHNLRRLNVETQEERPLLANDSKGWLAGGPIFSPDGKKIAILWNQPPAQGAWIITLTTLSERLLSPGTNPFGWSADGNSIYAVADSNRREVVQIGLDSKKPKSVTTLPGDINGGTVSLDGRHMIVSVGEQKSDVWLMKDFDPQTARAR